MGSAVWLLSERSARIPARSGRPRSWLPAFHPLPYPLYPVSQEDSHESLLRGAGSDSDIDILVAFDGPATSERYFGVQFHLEDLLGRPVDLVTEKALRPELRPFVEKEAVHV